MHDEEVYPVSGDDLQRKVVDRLLDCIAEPSELYSFVSQMFVNGEGSRLQVKRRAEVSMRNLSLDERDAFTEAKRKEWVSCQDQKAVELAEGRLSQRAVKSQSPWTLGPDLQKSR